MKFEIPGRLPGLNEIIEAAKQGKVKFQPYAMMKEEYTTMIGWLAKKLPKYEKVVLILTWYEPDRRRDPAYLMAGQKFILDGLVQAGTIPNDSQRHIQGIIHRFDVDKKNPRVEVEILDMEKELGDFEGQELWS